MSFPLGVIVDANVDYLLKRHFFYPVDFVTQIATQSGTATAAPATLTAGYYNSAAVPNDLRELAGTRQQAVRIATIAATLSARWTPYDMDNRWPVYIRYHWTSDAAAASVATFNTFFALGTSGILTATPSTAVTQVVVGDAKGTAADVRAVTRWGHIAPVATGPFAFQTFPATADEVVFNVSVSSVSFAAIGTSFVWLEKMELAYTPRQTFGDGSGREARYMNQILSTGPQEAGPTFSIKSS